MFYTYCAANRRHVYQEFISKLSRCSPPCTDWGGCKIVLYVYVWSVCVGVSMWLMYIILVINTNLITLQGSREPSVHQHTTKPYKQRSIPSCWWLATFKKHLVQGHIHLGVHLPYLYFIDCNKWAEWNDWKHNNWKEHYKTEGLLGRQKNVPRGIRDGLCTVPCSTVTNTIWPCFLFGTDIF